MPIDYISPLSNYPREELLTISAQHSAAFLAFQFWQRAVLVLFTVLSIAAVAQVTVFNDSPIFIYMTCIGGFGTVAWVMSLKPHFRLANVAGWKKQDQVLALFLQLFAFIACLGLVGPWLVQYYAARSIPRTHVSIVWPFLSNAQVQSAIALQAK